MIITNKISTKSRGKGFTLLELMVALSLGVLLLLGLMSIYIVAQRADDQNRALNANDEVARQVFRILGNNLDHAGYIDPLDSPANAFPASGSCAGTPTTSLYGSRTADITDTSIEDIYRRYTDSDATKSLPDGLLTAIGRASCGAMMPVIGCGSQNNFSNRPDIFSGAVSTCSSTSANDERQAIEIAYQALATGGHGFSNLNNTAVGSNATDCTGVNTTDAQNGFVVNQFFLMDDNGESSFACQSNLQNNDTALVQGVEELMFRYITTIQETDSTIKLGSSDSGNILASYKTAQELYTESADITKLDWATVVGVEVCVVVSAPNRVSKTLSDLAKTQGDNRPSCKRKADGTYDVVAKANDRKNRYYQRFDRVFRIPNALFLAK